MAKFLINLRKLDSPENEVQTQSLWDFLVPSKYDLVVAAAVQLAFPYMDDIHRGSSFPLKCHKNKI